MAIERIAQPSDRRGDGVVDGELLAQNAGIVSHADGSNVGGLLFSIAEQRREGAVESVRRLRRGRKDSFADDHLIAL